jgi:hypothetical protein
MLLEKPRPNLNQQRPTILPMQSKRRCQTPLIARVTRPNPRWLGLVSVYAHARVNPFLSFKAEMTQGKTPHQSLRNNCQYQWERVLYFFGRP